MSNVKRFQECISALAADGPIDRRDLVNVALGDALSTLTDEQMQSLIQRITRYQRQQWDDLEARNAEHRAAAVAAARSVA